MLIFSDMHFGIDKNSDERLNDAMNVLEWIVSEAKKYGEDTCVFAGDWLHDRNEINVKTATKAKDGLKYIAGNFKQFFMIAGNHDYYYNNSNDVASISLFDDVSGVKIVKNDPELLNCNGKKILLTPWFYNPNQEVGTYDAMIGHFEFIGGRMAGGYSKIGHNPKSMLSVAPLVFTGHYHLTSELERENGKIISIGSPYQQDWGDCGDKKRIIRFDGTNWESIYNSVSPQFNKIGFSKLSAIPEETLIKFFSNPVVKNGFIKIVSDSVDSSIDKIGKLLELGSSVGIRKIEADYSFINSAFNESVEGGMNEIASKDIRTYVNDFIDEQITNNNEYQNISAEKAHELVNRYFDVVNGASEK